MPKPLKSMDTPASEVLVPLIVFSAAFGMFYIWVTARHRQRMAMIEKGLATAEPASEVDRFSSLKFGLLGIGVGFGLLLGYLFQTYAMVNGEDNPLPYFVMVAICGGAALVGHHMIVVRSRGK
ncbi:MAG: hypothetical protein IPO60_05815 [Flavobacteriales bacterium]|nr:hypothetical protein [Flavobacteriales bacterium]MBK6893737.1 hypothetical protein [Flavobacteriales bacterium]MBK7248554.1 hypothetical protein [Flavobacteriales bacterium]MBK9597841.1 hypothetical protein [Flavobacteriales bacterium]QQS73812.1 MAG: hypothetical protein IPP95_06240 [Flavobacteriales bacterium]